MPEKIQGRKAVLLLVLFFSIWWMGGCSHREKVVYTAGLAIEDQPDDAKEQTDADGVQAHDDGQNRQSPGGSYSAKEQTGGQSAQALEESDSQSTQTPGTEGYVYVCGAVRSPGVYPLHTGMRVFEVIRDAGGFLPEADEDWLNQAELLHDGQQIYIYTDSETQQMERSEAAHGMDSDGQQAAERTDGKVNLNTADAQTLMTLPGIGQAKAEAIIQYRGEHGPFTSTEDIKNISGIKEAVFSKIEDQITV